MTSVQTTRAHVKSWVWGQYKFFGLPQTPDSSDVGVCNVPKRSCVRGMVLREGVEALTGVYREIFKMFGNVTQKGLIGPWPLPFLSASLRPFSFSRQGFSVSSGCPGTHLVGQAGLHQPASAFHVLALKACATTARPCSLSLGVSSFRTSYASAMTRCLTIGPNETNLDQKGQEYIRMDYTGTFKLRGEKKHCSLPTLFKSLRPGFAVSSGYP